MRNLTNIREGADMEGTMKKNDYQDERWKMLADKIRELDHHQCKMCGAKNVELHVHHLSYPPPPFHIWDASDSELVTLCKDCHDKIHECTTRPTLSEDRKLSVVIFRKDENGERMVSQSLYADLCKRGYNGKPYTQQIIDWFINEHWIMPRVCIHFIYETCADGRECDMASDFNYASGILNIRGSCSYPGEEFETIEEAEIDAIKLALESI